MRSGNLVGTRDRTAPYEGRFGNGREMGDPLLPHKRERLMKKEHKEKLGDDLRPEYDLKVLLKSGIR